MYLLSFSFPSIPALAKTHGVQLKAGGAMLRLRLYQALILLPPSAYEGVRVCMCVWVCVCVCVCVYKNLAGIMERCLCI